MSVEIKDAGDARKVALVTFESDEVTSQESQVCKQFGRMANIPGFRKGKAPENVIRKKYSKELKEELNRKVSTTAYEAVLDHEDIRVYSILKVDAGEVEANSPATVEVTVDVEPEFDLPAYEEFEYTIRSTGVSKEASKWNSTDSETKEHPSKKWIAKWRTAITSNALTRECSTENLFPKFFLTNRCMGNSPTHGRRPDRPKAWALRESPKGSLA